MENGGWIGVDLDGTLAVYTGWQGPTHIGPPVPKMLARVKQWLASGIEVKIFTARANDQEALNAIHQWCKQHVGRDLNITSTKDYAMVELWDDRAVQVIPNTGNRADGVKDETY